VSFSAATCSLSLFQSGQHQNVQPRRRPAVFVPARLKFRQMIDTLVA